MIFYVAEIVVDDDLHWSQLTYGDQEPEDALEQAARDARYDVGADLLQHLKIFGPFEFDADQPAARFS